MRIIAALTDPASIRSCLDGVGLPGAAGLVISLPILPPVMYPILLTNGAKYSRRTKKGSYTS